MRHLFLNITGQDFNLVFFSFQIIHAKSGTAIQKNFEGAAYNVQLSYIESQGTMLQENSENTVGNVQVNVGTIGRQINDEATSSNLQLNLIECDIESEDSVKHQHGNVRVVKCVDFDKLTTFQYTYNGEIIAYRIRFNLKESKLVINNGNVLIDIDISFLYEDKK